MFNFASQIYGNSLQSNQYNSFDLLEDISHLSSAAVPSL